MILRGLNAIITHLDEVKRENFAAWGERNGLGRIGPVVSDYDADYELELTGYQAVGAAGDYFDVPNR